MQTLSLLCIHASMMRGRDPTPKELELTAASDYKQAPELVIRVRTDSQQGSSLITCYHWASSVRQITAFDDPVAEEVLEWTIAKDARDVAQIMHWLFTNKWEKDRMVLMSTAKELIDDAPFDQRLDEPGEIMQALVLAGGRSLRMVALSHHPNRRKVPDQITLRD